ncbi:helix-turn-helix domain-containing protein [Streptomyces ficellus]|uniref:Helix-turn-helix domain-containing protein n=1 Tax=Streptomyces ficellus TaxID=1977088 RepID=A0ABT7ZB12_9ACTN|nr:helix-turn-helix domain-containing protein [Streptomyces ficellus]MDN3296698.1 helix-turn-helix domain-containing protein [Streptomyces ficellus]
MTATTSGSRSAPRPPLPTPKERRRLREARSLTEEQLARLVGVTRATVRSWETGRTSPRGRKREAYVKLLSAAPGTETAHKPTEPPPRPQPREKARDKPDPPAAPATPAEAFDLLYAHAAPALVRQAYVLTGRRGLSREAVEYAFHLAWERWPQVAVDRDPAGWVRVAAHEYALSPWHRLRRSHRHPDGPTADRAARALHGALLDLPPAYRRTLLLYDGLGLDLPETAAETEASTPAAGSRVLRARAVLAERIPELADPTVLQTRLASLLDKGPALLLAPPSTVRTGSERRVRYWTRGAIGLTAVIVAATAFTLATAPTSYRPPVAPGAAVGGVPQLSGPQRLTPADAALRARLATEPVTGPARLVPEPH